MEVCGRWERWLWEVTHCQQIISRKEAQYLLWRLASEAYYCHLEGCHVWQPTLDLGWTGVTGSSYLCYMEVGTY
jgi:hypothetical protein